MFNHPPDFAQSPPRSGCRSATVASWPEDSDAGGQGFMIQTGDPQGDGTGGESIWGGEFEERDRRRRDARWRGSNPEDLKVLGAKHLALFFNETGREGEGDSDGLAQKLLDAPNWGTCVFEEKGAEANVLQRTVRCRVPNSSC